MMLIYVLVLLGCDRVSYIGSAG